MLGVKGHAELSHLEERLKLILGSESYPFSLDLLTESAVTGSLTAESVLILAQEYFPNTESHQLIGLARPILEVLEHDGYLVQDQGGYRFESKLLQDWWKRRYQFFCTPASQRGRS